jgi:hypothetical protein
MELKPRIIAFLAALALAGCGSSERAPSGYTAGAERLSALFARGVAAPPQPVLTRAILDQVTGPLMRITGPDGAAATLEMAARRDGGMVIWRDSSRTLIHLRNGLISATRGLQDDLNSADTAPARTAIDAALRKNEAGTATRTMIFLDGAFRQVRVIYECQIVPQGPETIAIVDKPYATQSVVETCVLQDRPVYPPVPARFENRYWFENDPQKTLRRSVQWGGPSLDLVTIEQLSP